VLSAVEHSSVREASDRLSEVVQVEVDRYGRLDPEALVEVLKHLEVEGRPAALVHLQLANHEVGTVQPVRELAAVARRAGALVHVDACAAAATLPVSLEELDADLLSLSGHKLGGPAGIGALVFRPGLRLEPMIVGGAQERARRAGFENLPAAAGFAAVADLLGSRERLEAEERQARGQVGAMLEAVLEVEGVSLLGDPDPAGRLANLACVAVEGVEAGGVLLALDQSGIAIHSGSACSSEALSPSPVLEAMGAPSDRSLRLSVGWSTTDDDVVAFTSAFPAALATLRSLGGRAGRHAG
jgi:cysteine desulfurase